MKADIPSDRRGIHFVPTRPGIIESLAPLSGHSPTSYLALMQIQHEDDGRRGRFFINEAGQELAEMYYEWHSADHFTILHTEVDDSLSGKGVAKQLLSRAVEYAREKGVTIRPVCAFAKKVMESTEEYGPVIYKH